MVKIKNHKRTNNDLLDIQCTHKTKYRVTRTSLKTGENLYHKIKYLEKISNKCLFKNLTDSFDLICTV
jgi:hypothetical protein